MKTEIDLDALFTAAIQHMEAPNDLRWSIGMALQDLYWDAWMRDLQQKMTDAYSKETT